MSAEIWDRNFTPGQTVSFPLWLFNDTDEKAALTARITVEDADGKIYDEHIVNRTLEPYSRISQPQTVLLPDRTGDYILRAELVRGRTAQVKYPVVSKWDIRTFRTTVPAEVAAQRIYIPADESELLAFARDNGLALMQESAQADLLLFGRKSWEHIAAGGTAVGETIRQALERGASAVLLDAGDIAGARLSPGKRRRRMGPPARRGQDRESRHETLRTVQGADAALHRGRRTGKFPISRPRTTTYCGRIMPAGYSGMWNGYRGGLTVPAYDMSIAGLSARSFLEQWAARGADRARITQGGHYYGYELQGFYAFSDKADDTAVEAALKERVRFLIEDAPALAVVMSADAPITVTDLAGGYEAAKTGLVENLEILANAGKDLTKSPVVAIGFGEGRGRLLVSQLLTEGRLSPGFGSDGLYGVLLRRNGGANGREPARSGSRYEKKLKPTIHEE